MPGNFICPYPLVYADHTKEYPKHYTTHWAYEYGNCAVRCPTIVLTENEYNDFNNTVWYVSLVSFSLSVVVLLFHLTEASRYSLRIYFIIGFLTGSFAFLAFPPLNHDLKLICSEDRAHYIEQNPICVSQSTFLVFSFSWIAIWGAIYAFDIYLVTLLTFDQIQLKRLRKYYPWFALVLTTSITSVGLIADNFGFDYTTSLPNCLYLFAQNDIYFWTTLVTPYGLSILLCFLASVGTIYRLQSVFVSGRRSNRQRLIQSVMNSFNRKNDSNTQIKQRNIAITSIGSNSNNSTATKISSPPPGSEADENSINNGYNDGGNVDIDEDDMSQSIDFSKKWSIDADRYPRHIESIVSESPDLFSRTISDPNYVNYVSTSPPSPSFKNNYINNDNDEGKIESTTTNIITKSPFQNIQLETVVENPITRDSSVEPVVDIENKSSTIFTVSNSNNNNNNNNNNSNIPLSRTMTTNSNTTISTTKDRTKSKTPSNYISSPSEASRASFNIELSETEEHRPTNQSVPDDDFLLSISSNDYFVEMNDSSVSTSMRYRSHLPSTHQPSKSGVYTVNTFETSQSESYNDRQQHHEQYLQQQQQEQDNTIFRVISSKLSGTWKYNGRVIIFISVYCAISAYILPVLVYLFHTTYNENVDSAEEFIGCLIGASFRSENQTQEAVDKFARHECGAYPSPRPPFVLMVSVCYWGAGFGIIPAIIFGSIFFEKIRIWFHKTFPKTLKAPLLR